MSTKPAGTCLICGGIHWKSLFSVRAYEIVRCVDCGLTKTLGNPQVDYGSYHRDEEYQKYSKLFKNIFLNRVNTITRFVKTPGRALEIGCSTGTLLSILKDKNWEVWGVEPSKSALVAASKGIRVVRKEFEQARLPQKYFDLIILNHTLEHLENPLSILAKANKLLNKGGIIFVDVPNFGSLGERLLGKKWPYIMPEEHLWHFSPSTLIQLLRKSGFRSIYSRTQSGIFDYANPLKGMMDKFLMGSKSFFFDLISVPFAFINTKIGMGSSLTVIGKNE
jgi:SAM-dependent methyltransferase